jgi:5-methylcytosine-specific restriction endonuclease McrA
MFNNKEYLKKWRLTHPNYNKEYQKLHRQRINETQRIRRQIRRRKHRKYLFKPSIMLSPLQIKNRLKAKKFRERHPEKMKLKRMVCKAKRRQAGNLSIKIIQRIYENNIKQFGTLTCIYCLKSIKFGNDSLEHKQPLFLGGTHDYENLAIACISCNCAKGKKTEKEYREYLLNSI